MLYGFVLFKLHCEAEQGTDLSFDENEVARDEEPSLVNYRATRSSALLQSGGGLVEKLLHSAQFVLAETERLFLEGFIQELEEEI